MKKQISQNDKQWALVVALVFIMWIGHAMVITKKAKINPNCKIKQNFVISK